MTERIRLDQGLTHMPILFLQHRWQRLGVACGLGVIAGFGQAPWGIWPLTLIALALFYGLIERTSGWREVGLVGWATGTGHYLLVLSWIMEPFQVDAVQYGWMAPFALIFLAGGLAMFWAGAAALWGKLRTSSLWSAPVFVACFVLMEWVRGWVFTGFPWAQIGHIWIDTRLMQWASVSGSLLLCALSLSFAVALWCAATKRALWAGVVLVLGGAAWLTAPLLETKPIPREHPALVRVIQPNAPQHEKWNPDFMGVFFSRQLDFTSQAPQPDLIVWPETSIPFYLNDATRAVRAISLAAGDASVIIGAHQEQEGQIYNTLAVVEPTGDIGDIYAKHHLVPFGEYLPLRSVMARLGLRGLAAETDWGYQPGPGPATISIPKVGIAAPLICYESVFARDVQNMPERAEFLLLITNDAWFGSISGPYQHLAQAQLRSVETGLPMVRSANTGVSAVIDATGQIVDQIPLNKAGYIDVSLPPPHQPTLYSQTGDWPVVLLCLLLLTLSFLFHRRFNQSD